MAFGWSNVARSPNPEQGHGHGIHGSPKRLQPSTFTTVSGMPGTPKDLGENRFVAHDAVTLGLHGVLPICDLIVGSDEEIQMLGGAANSVAALRNIRARTSATVDLKRGERGCWCFRAPCRMSSKKASLLLASRGGVQRSWRRGRCSWEVICGAGCAISRSNNEKTQQRSALKWPSGQGADTRFIRIGTARPYGNFPAWTPLRRHMHRSCRGRWDSLLRRRRLRTGSSGRDRCSRI